MLGNDAMVKRTEEDGSEYQSSGKSKCGWRHAICVTIFIIVLICYADRTNIGIVLAQTDLNISPNDKGIVLSSFFIGYMLTQIIGGYLARRYGCYTTFLLAATTWTAFDVLTPFAASLGLIPLILVRIGMGLGEGMTFPAQHALTSFWVPTREKAFLVMFMTSGQDIGSVLANVVSPRLLERGVALVFVSWGCLACAWCICYSTFFASAPELHNRCRRSGEAAWIVNNRRTGLFVDVQRSRESMLPFRLLKEPCIWGIVIGHIGCNYAWYVMLSWMPSYFKGVYTLDLADNPVTLALPYLASWLGAAKSGKLSDWLVWKGVRSRRVRKLMQLVGAVGSTVLFQVAARMDSHISASVCVSIALFFGRFQSAGFWISMLDVCPESAPTVMGISNTIATIPGIIGQPITQSILNHAGGEHSNDAWAIVFGVGGCVSIVAAAIFAGLGDDRNLDSDQTSEASVSLQ